MQINHLENNASRKFGKGIWRSQFKHMPFDERRTGILCRLCKAGGLLVRERQGFFAPNRLYVKVPQIPLVQFSDHMTAIQPEKPTPNQLTINKRKEKQRKGASEKPPAPFGRYQNVLLSESEYTELKEVKCYNKVVTGVANEI